MSAVNQVSVAGLPDGLKQMFAAALWAWIDANAETQVWRFSFKVGPIPISKTFRVKDLHAVYETILGPRPVA